ncbi:alpha/beta fold hydrolase [Granulosicoccaceae sp. 1_MG-2023]|nr:alpha/beta fold hydrolase [Granulosicoccaceae sp. 1_MG-2023]
MFPIPIVAPCLRCAAALPLMALLWLLPLSLHAREQPSGAPAQGQGDLHGPYSSLDSGVLGETQRYSVDLPKGYDAQKRYPVIYLLDGDSHRTKLLGVIEGLTDGLQPAMPSAIVVGLDGRKRMRDYTPTHTLKLPNGQPGSKAYKVTGGGERFLDFIEQELQAVIDADYATSGVTILMGHSFGGLLALEALRSDRAFNAVVAIDPSLWFDYPAYQQRLTKESGLSGGRHSALFIAASDNPFTPGLGLSSLHSELIRGLSDTLQQRASPDFAVRGQFYPGSDHSSVVLPAIEDSLRWLFEGYRIAYGAQGPDAETVIGNYRRLSRRLGAQIRPDRERLQFNWAYINTRLPEAQRSDLFEALLKHYYPQLPVEPRGTMAH